MNVYSCNFNVQFPRQYAHTGILIRPTKPAVFAEKAICTLCLAGSKLLPERASLFAHLAVLAVSFNSQQKAARRSCLKLHFQSSVGVSLDHVIGGNTMVIWHRILSVLRTSSGSLVTGHSHTCLAWDRSYIAKSIHFTLVDLLQPGIFCQ